MAFSKSPSQNSGFWKTLSIRVRESKQQPVVINSKSLASFAGTDFCRSLYDALWPHADSRFNLKRAVAGFRMAHLAKITSAFEFSVLTLTVPGLRLRKVQNPLCF
jgi:hypothetical protein